MTTSLSEHAVPKSLLSNRFVDAELVVRPQGHPITGRAVVVNPGVTPAYVDEVPKRPIPAFSSTILVDTTIQHAESVLVFRMTDGIDVSAIVHEDGWQRYADLLPEVDEDAFPSDTALWRGPREHWGTTEFDPGLVLGDEPTGPRAFDVMVNLWFAPAGTDCVIHTGHDFVEVHTQLHGIGRMQKFRERDHATLYEDVLMAPGYTTPVPFCGLDPAGGFAYPWHQYRADTDCVWLAIEYHVR